MIVKGIRIKQVEKLPSERGSCQGCIFCSGTKGKLSDEACPEDVSCHGKKWVEVVEEPKEILSNGYKLRLVDSGRKGCFGCEFGMTGKVRFDKCPVEEDEPNTICRDGNNGQWKVVEEVPELSETDKYKMLFESMIEERAWHKAEIERLEIEINKLRPI